ILLVLVARPVTFLLRTYYNDPVHQTSAKPGFVNDASNLNETKVEAVVNVAEDTAQAIPQIVQLVKQAALTHKKISIAGARHSMGGHTIYPGGIVLDMRSMNYMHYDSSKNTVLVGSGTLWSRLIPYLDERDKSIAVMQSNNSFSVGGSISVNCHGWQPDSPPIASTVESFRLITADGNIVTCNRQQNKELFSLVLGGYGLFGVILDVELRVIDNKVYKVHQHVIKSKDYIGEFTRLVKNDPAAGMAYGRININPQNFMEEAILSVYRVDSAHTPGPVKQNGLQSLRRTVFRGSANSEYGKKLRWKLEKWSASLIDGKRFSRNQLLNEGVEVFQNADSNYTDILHEYFIPTANVGKFIDSLKQELPKHKVDLLNITIRNVMQDKDAYLAYANEEVFGFVMLYNQRKDNAADSEMRILTRRLIDIAISLDGKYYLPYRLHATREQMYAAYPQARSFFQFKRTYDPDEIFQNQFYESYK
ncbi:MAG TPA: FAD-binding oxidoreductase, partial [Chitinophagaceae bacterium]